MSNAQFKTETSTMATSAIHVREVNQNITASLNGLLGKLEALYSTWQGRGAQSFDALKQRWTDSTNKLNQSLDGISTAIDKTRVQYEQSEEASETDFKGVAGNL